MGVCGLNEALLSLILLCSIITLFTCFFEEKRVSAFFVLHSGHEMSRRFTARLSF